MSQQAVTLSYLDNCREVLNLQQAMDEKYNQVRLHYINYEKVGYVLDYLTENKLDVSEKVISDLNQLRKEISVLNDEFDQLAKREDALRKIVGDYRDLKHVVFMLLQDKAMTYEELAEAVNVKKEKLLNIGAPKQRLTFNELKRICDYFELDIELYKKHVVLK